MSKVIHKPQPISGFPEWSPEIRRVELQWLDTIRRVFESYGFINLETPSVEALEVIDAKGATDKELYVLQRLHTDPDEAKEARLALHFDLTVPMARYVAQHFNNLSFPFKRYQLQRVWRGERPQEGRFREFYQCDIDVIAVDQLPLHFDGEMPLIMFDLLTALKISDVQIHLNNRKILEGFLRGLDVAEPMAAIRALDKLDKASADMVHAELQTLGMHAEAANKALALAQIKTSDNGFAQQVSALGVSHALLAQGMEELSFVMSYLKDLPAGAVAANLGIARGLDYYTGTVYEGKFTSYPDFGTVIAGGRYDDLAGSYINKHLPGVGISFGLTRLFSKLLKEGHIQPIPASPTQILIALLNEEDRPRAQALAQDFRARGLNVEVYHAAQKVQKQLGYADKKSIPYVWFLGADGAGDEVKNMQTGEQIAADANTWLFTQQ